MITNEPLMLNIDYNGEMKEKEEKILRKIFEENMKNDTKKSRE